MDAENVLPIPSSAKFLSCFCSSWVVLRKISSVFVVFIVEMESPSSCRKEELKDVTEPFACANLLAIAANVTDFRLFRFLLTRLSYVEVPSVLEVVTELLESTDMVREIGTSVLTIGTSLEAGSLLAGGDGVTGAVGVFDCCSSVVVRHSLAKVGCCWPRDSSGDT